jgi:phosphatidate cytidylyltransferase
MTPRLSPKKTWEGVAGQFVGAMGVSLLLSVSPWALMGPRTALLYGACIAVVAIFGDLAASLLKRQAELDDWGQLLPGFGGIMDMLDDVLFAAPASLAFLRVCEMIGSGG